MKYRKLLKLMLGFIKGNEGKRSAEIFCNEFMDYYYNFQGELENEVTQCVYEMFDDVNVICDPYEPNAEIRKTDKYCIDEIALRNKVTEIYKKIEELMS